MNIKHIDIGTYQKENDHLIVDLDKELPNLTDVRINGIWFEKSLLKNDEHTSAFYRARAREEYRRLRDLEQLCRTLFERYDPWDWQINDGVISYDEAYLLDRIDDLEQLCRDVWEWANQPHGLEEGYELHKRMVALGLLEE